MKYIKSKEELLTLIRDSKGGPGGAMARLLKIMFSDILEKGCSIDWCCWF